MDRLIQLPSYSLTLSMIINYLVNNNFNDILKPPPNDVYGSTNQESKSFLWFSVARNFVQICKITLEDVAVKLTVELLCL